MKVTGTYRIELSGAEVKKLRACLIEAVISIDNNPGLTEDDRNSLKPFAVTLRAMLPLEPEDGKQS